MRRDFGPSCSSHEIEKPDEYHQGDLPGAGEPEIAGGGGEGVGEEAGGCEEGILCWDCMNTEDTTWLELCV